MLKFCCTLQVAGPFLQQYDVYYKRLDPDGKEEIAAMVAATFLKKSGLPDDVLGKVMNIDNVDCCSWL